VNGIMWLSVSSAPSTPYTEEYSNEKPERPGSGMRGHSSNFVC
jgi:hypothetical protein